METKKTTMLGAVLAVAIIAFAGVGYAATYHATTTNGNNTMTSTYLTLSQDGAGAYTADFLKDLLYDSENTGTVNGTTITQSTVYKPVYTGTLDETTYTEGADGDVALISNALTLNVTPNNDQGADEAVLTVTVKNVTGTTEAAFTGNSAMSYVMVIKSATASVTYAQAQEISGGTNCPGGWTFSGVPVDETAQFSVQLFVKLNGTTTSLAADNTSTGFAVTGNAGETKSVFTFTLTATA